MKGGGVFVSNQILRVMIYLAVDIVRILIVNWGKGLIKTFITGNLILILQDDSDPCVKLLLMCDQIKVPKLHLTGLPGIQN